MTNCRKKMPVVPLNLNNFESSIISAGCPYVLTSPRSLRACKKAGIKPVELLYQSTSQIADDLGVHPKYVTDVFLQRETDRQKKLDLVRKIRNDIIADETLIKSLDLAHHKDNLTCLSTCSRGNRTPTSLRRRHHSSLHHLKGLALRELRSEQVRSLARELDQGLERWQDHVMILQWQAVQRAEASASIQLQTKRLRTECENRERQL